MRFKKEGWTLTSRATCCRPQARTSVRCPSRRSVQDRPRGGASRREPLRTRADRGGGSSERASVPARTRVALVGAATLLRGLIDRDYKTVHLSDALLKRLKTWISSFPPTRATQATRPLRPSDASGFPRDRTEGCAHRLAGCRGQCSTPSRPLKRPTRAVARGLRQRALDDKAQMPTEPSRT